MKFLLIAISCYLVGITAGWFHRGDGISSVSEPSSRHSPRLRSERVGNSPRAIPQEIDALLAPIRAARAPEERLRGLIHLARSIPVAELGRWYDGKWLERSIGGDLEVFYEITRGRWLAEDPEGIINKALAENWSETDGLSGRWALKSPEKALAYLRATTDRKDRSRLEGAMLGPLAISLPADVLSMIRFYDGPTGARHRWERAFESLAKHHPDLLEKAELPAALRVSARVSLVRNRLESDFNRELAALIQSPTGFFDLKAALDDYQTASKVSAQFLAELPKMPKEWVKALDGWNPYGILRKVASPVGGDASAPSPEQVAAIQQARAAYGEISRESMRGLEDAVQTLDPARLAEYGYSNSSGLVESIPVQLQSSVLAAMIQHPPQEISEDAFRRLMHQTANFSARWALEDAVAASRWADQLPPSDARRWALRNVAANWLPHDRPGASAWLERLPEDDRRELQEFLEENRLGR